MVGLGVVTVVGGAEVVVVGAVVVVVGGAVVVVVLVVVGAAVVEVEVLEEVVGMVVVSWFAGVEQDARTSAQARTFLTSPLWLRWPELRQTDEEDCAGRSVRVGGLVDWRDSDQSPLNLPLPTHEQFEGRSPVGVRVVVVEVDQLVE